MIVLVQGLGVLVAWKDLRDGPIILRDLEPKLRLAALADDGGARISPTLPSILLPAHSIIHLLPLLLILTHNKRNCLGYSFSCDGILEGVRKAFLERHFFSYCRYSNVYRGISKSFGVLVIKSVILLLLL